jgi:hypothetical protein
LKAVDLLTVNTDSAILQKQVAHLSEKSEKENSKLQSLEEKHRQEIINLEEKMEQQFKQVVSMIKQNPVLAQVKPEVLTKKNAI